MNTNPSYTLNGLANTQIPPSQDIAVQQVQGTPFSPFGNVVATISLASAATIGANMVDVRNGSMTLPQAVVNGLAKGAVVSYILSRTTRATTGEVLFAAGFLAGAGFLIDSQMKKCKQQKDDEVVA